MICSSNEKDMTAEEIYSIGKDFATRFYDAFVGKPDASALIRFFDYNSKYSFVQRCSGRPDYEVQGAKLIGELAERMQYGRCTSVTVRSVDTNRVGSSQFKVSVIGELLCPANDFARKFLQTTVIKRVAWTRAQFVVIDTVFRFTDRIVDDVLPRTSSVNRRLFVPLQPVVVAVPRVDVGRESVKPVAVKCGPRGESSRPRITGNCKQQYFRNMDVFNSNVAKTPKCTPKKDEPKTIVKPMNDPQESVDAASKALTGRPTDESCKGDGDKNVASSSTNDLEGDSRKEQTPSAPAVKVTPRTTCVRKTRNVAKDPMAELLPSYIGSLSGVPKITAKQKAGSEKPTAALGDGCKQSSSRTDDTCSGTVVTAVVPNEKPMVAKTQPAADKPMAAPKVETNKTPSAGENAVDKKQGRPKERPIRDVEKVKTFVSTNRFRCLTVADDGSDSHSSNADITMSPSENTTVDLTRREKNRKRNRNRNNRLRRSLSILPRPEGVTATGQPTENETTLTPVDSSPKDSGHRTNISNDLWCIPHTLAGPEEVTTTEVPTENEISMTPVHSSSNDSGKMSTNLESRDRSSSCSLENLPAVLDDAPIISPAPTPAAAADTSNSCIRRVGSIYGRAFITEVIYPLLYNINPLDWF